MTDILKKGPTGMMENRLVPTKCKTGSDDIRPVCLLGLVDLEKNEEETEGWILIIAGDPLIPHKAGKRFLNQIPVDRLLLTFNQKQAIIQNSIVRDGCVYLYGGKFTVGKCLRSRECQQDYMNVLKVLSDHMNEHILELDLTRVIPLKEKMLCKIMMPKQIKKKRGAGLHKEQEICSYQLIDEFKEISGRKDEKIKFRCTDHHVFVEVECPVNHSGYHVDILLLETFICKPNVLDACDRSRITRIVEQADIIVPPNLTCILCASSEEPTLQWMTITLKRFPLPSYQTRCERRILDNFKVRWVEFRGMAHFIKEGEWKGMAMEKLMIEQVDPKVEGRADPVAVKLSSSSSKQNVDQEQQSYQSPSVGSSSSGVYPNCSIPVKLVVMEVELVGQEEDEGETGDEKEWAAKRSSTW